MPIEFRKGHVPEPAGFSAELDVLNDVVKGVGEILVEAKKRAEEKYGSDAPPEIIEAEILRQRFVHSKNNPQPK